MVDVKQVQEQTNFKFEKFKLEIEKIDEIKKIGNK